MNSTKCVITFFLLFTFISSNAQNFELGNVSFEELLEKRHPIDTSAAAAILYKKAKTYFVYERGNGYYLYHDYSIRIKVYKKEGLKWANYKVHYVAGQENIEPELVKFSNCITYNIEDERMITTPLTTEGNLKTNINKYWNEAIITMPNVKVGSVFEIRYTIKSRRNVRFPIFYFQYEIPVNYAEYETDVPEVFIYKTIGTGYDKIDTFTKIVNEKESFSHKYNQESDFPFKYQLSTYKAENIPALKDESFVDNLKNYRSSIQHELERTRFPFDDVVDYSMTWDGVAKNIYDYNSFGRELEKDNYLEEDLKKIVGDITTESDKLKAIFKFVQQKMNWDGYHDILTDKGVKKAYKEETGNAAEINFILIAMLNSAGIKAHPVLISTRGNGVPTYPNRTMFNAVIVAAEIDGEQILLDATNKYSSVGVLPLEDLNWTGRLIKKEGDTQEINLVPNKVSNENINLVVVIDDKGKISGQTSIKKTNYEALGFREKNGKFVDEKYLEKLEANLGGILIEDHELKDDMNKSSSIVENFNFVSNNHCEIINYKMYLNPLLFYNSTINPFIQEKRLMPIYFGYPIQEKYNINIEIPQGYIVEYLPKPIKIATVNQIASFSINIQSVGNKIQIAITKEINSAMVPADYYDALKDFFQKVIDKQNEKIVLRKV
jgi:hypothetical protein